ncbi:MAG: S8 family peptidase [Candidatus Competibacteraceae bacterium]|nr:MAG: S8 family peptidase [Candidatus Competibacteraceae bacterium]
MDNPLYPHIRIAREEPLNPKRPRKGFSPSFTPQDPSTHGKILLNSLHNAKEQAKHDIGGFDERLLFKLSVDKGFKPEDIENIPGVEVVSQEDEGVLLAFASEQALDDFEARLSSLAKGEKPIRATILYALQNFDSWTEEDRKGWALKQEGLPDKDLFLLDVELWPMAKQPIAETLKVKFEVWLKENGIEKKDVVNQPTLLMYRVQVNRETAALLLNHRDVRTVDLPPNYGLDRRLFSIEIQEIPEIQPPPENAPGVVILDSGLATGHPLLKAAIGDAQGFFQNGRDAFDDHGHGTCVAGIALYGDIEKCIQEKLFVPVLRLFSGRILDTQGQNDSGFVENHVIEAVRYFYENYKCRIFNLSFGDKRKPYLGKHVRGLATTLDSLSRELGILFVVSVGNFGGTESIPKDWKAEYPHYLLTDEAALLDPAPAINVLTVGSIARFDQTFTSQHYSNSIEHIPIARRNQPSPFTRHGPSVNGAIKPEIVTYGGNWALHARAINNYPFPGGGLGEISTSIDFARGKLFQQDCGTSYAAPNIAHIATKVLTKIPDANPNLIRALLVAHCRHPQACKELFQESSDLNRVCGYGQIQETGLLSSTENEVTLFAEASIPDKHHHFYEIPIPEDFYSKGKREREITVALAFCPLVRTTRIDYKAARISFKLVEANNLEEVTNCFNAATSSEEYERIEEMNGNRSLSDKDRSKGTVQACTWIMKKISDQRKKKRLFIVVTRNGPPWGTLLSEEQEAYSLVILLRDLYGKDVRLYTQIQNHIQIKMRQRVKV